MVSIPYVTSDVYWQDGDGLTIYSWTVVHTEGSHNLPQIQNITHEKACNRAMTFKDIQGHYIIAAIR